MPEGRKTIKIIDSEVFDERDANVAMSKSDFARNVAEGHGAFKNLDASTFKPILDIIQEIVDDAQPRRSILFHDMNEFEVGLDDLSSQQQLSRALSAAIQMARRRAHFTLHP